METRLTDYGIQNENSDIRIHVCPTVRRVYLYETASVQDILENYPERPAYQVIDGESVLTAKGRIVPVSAIPDCREIALPAALWQAYPIKDEDSTSRKGSQAVELVRAAISRRYIVLPISAAVITDVDMQIDGTDIMVMCRLRIQVKCDFKGGSKALGGTGNLYLQTAECNPLKAT